MPVVRVARSAQTDVRKIIQYLAAYGGLDPASDFAHSFERLKQTLATHPLAYSARPELGRGIRCAVIRPYLAIYRHQTRDDVVVLLRVLHGSRKIGPDFRAMI